MARSCKAHTTKSDWVINIVHVGPTLKIIVRRWFWTSIDVYWGAIVFSQIRRSWKSWGSQIVFFLWKILGSQLKINKKLLGGYNILLQFWGGAIQFLIIKDGGNKILPRYLWIFMNPYSKVWWPHNSFIYVFFDKLNFMKQWFQRSLI